MKITRQLIVSRTGNVRMNQSGTGLKANEIAVEIRLDIPDGYFRKPHPVVDIKVPVGDEPPPVEVVVATTSEAVANAMNVRIEDVRDGLMEALRRKEVKDQP